MYQHHVPQIDDKDFDNLIFDRMVFWGFGQPKKGPRRQSYGPPWAFSGLVRVSTLLKPRKESI